MTGEEARGMIEPAGGWGGAAEWWADLGCGRGTFTRALADLLGPDGRIVAVDVDRRALDALPRERGSTSIEARHLAIDAFEPHAPLDGVLMANVLHYEPDAPALLARVGRMLRPAGRLLLVEYDTDKPAPPWVPYPVSSHRARNLLEAAGWRDVRPLTSRRSRYRRSHLYSMIATRRP